MENSVDLRLYDMPSSRVVRVSKESGRKDRHSKVLTSKGTVRDRRVRLSVNTAIQFYDLQERLGFDQPSKALDWLLKESVNSITELPVLKQENMSNSLERVAEEKEKENVNNGISQATSFTALLSGETTNIMDYFGGVLGANHHQQQFPIFPDVNAAPREYHSTGSSDLKVSSSFYIDTVWNHHQVHSQRIDNNDRNSNQKGKQRTEPW